MARRFEIWVTRRDGTPVTAACVSAEDKDQALCQFADCSTELPPMTMDEDLSFACVEVTTTFVLDADRATVS